MQCDMQLCHNVCVGARARSQLPLVFFLFMTDEKYPPEVRANGMSVHISSSRDKLEQVLATSMRHKVGTITVWMDGSQYFENSFS